MVQASTELAALNAADRDAFVAALAGVFESGPAAWTGLGRTRQMLLVGLAVILIVGGFVGSQWMGKTTYVPLFALLPASAMLASRCARKVQ